MPIARHDVDERQARIDGWLPASAPARQRARVKQGTALWTRTEEALRQAARAEAPPTKVN